MDERGGEIRMEIVWGCINLIYFLPLICIGNNFIYFMEYEIMDETKKE
jgi:hypothetical protein